MIVDVFASMLPVDPGERVAIVCGPGGGGPGFVRRLLAAAGGDATQAQVGAGPAEPDLYRANGLTVADLAVRAGITVAPDVRIPTDARILVVRDRPVEEPGLRVVDLRTPGGPGETLALRLLDALPNLTTGMRWSLAASLRGATQVLAELVETGSTVDDRGAWPMVRQLPTFRALFAEVLGHGGQRLLDLGRLLLLVAPQTVDCSDEWPRLASALAGRTYAVSDLAMCLSACPGLFEVLPGGAVDRVKLSSGLAASLLEANVPTSASEHAALYLALRERAVTHAWGPDTSDRFVAEQLPRQAVEGGMLEELAADASALLACDPYTLVELLETEPARMLAPGFKAYLLCSHRMFDNRHRASQLELAARRAGLDDFASAVKPAHSQRVWSADWARAQAVNVHRVLLSLRSPCLSVCSDTDGMALWAGYSDGSIWRMHPYQPAREVWRKSGAGAEVRAIAVGTVEGQTIIVAGTSDQTVTVIRPDTGAVLWEDRTSHDGPLSAVAVGSTSTSVVLASAGVSTDIYLHRWLGDRFASSLAYRHGAEIRGLAFVTYAGRNLLFFCSVDGVVGALDVDHPERNSTLVVAPVVFNSVHAVVTGDRITVVLGASTGVVYRFVVEVSLGSFGEAPPIANFGEPAIVTRHRADVNTVRLAHHEGRLVVLSGASDGIWRITDLETFHTNPIVGHAGPVWSLAWFELYGRTYVVTGGGEGACRLWRPSAALAEQIALEQANRHRGGIRSVAVMRRDDEVICLTGGDDGGVRIWPSTDANGGSIVVNHGQPVNAMIGIGPTPDHPAGRLVSGGADGTLRVTDLGPDGASELLGVAHEGVTSLSLTTAQNTELLASGGLDGSVILWDLKSGTALQTSNVCRFGGVTSLCFVDLNDDWKLIAGGQDGSLSLLDSTLAVQHRVTVDCAVLSLGQVPASRYMAVAGLADGRMALIHHLDAMVGEDVAFINAHDSEVRSVVSFRLAGRPVIASGGLDRSLSLWDVDTTIRLARVDLDGYALAVDALTPWVAIGSSAGAALIEFADDPVVLISGVVRS